MSTIIKFNLKELKQLANDKNSCINEKKVTQNLALQPWCLGNIKQSVKNLLDYKIGKFDKEFNGILLSYKNSKILQNVGTIRNDNADVYYQVQAEYFIFQPYVGATLTGVVNKKSNTHLAILVHRVFNVVIPRPTEQPGDIWIGSRIEEGQIVTFRIVFLDLFGALPYIRGELDESSVQEGPDGYDIDEECKTVQTINVSYVDFDKTKPAKHNLIQSRSNCNSNNSEIFEKECTNKNSESEPINGDKDKGKKRNRSQVSEKSDESIVKASKKHKRETQ